MRNALFMLILFVPAVALAAEPVIVDVEIIVRPKVTVAPEVTVKATVMKHVAKSAVKPQKQVSRKPATQPAIQWDRLYPMPINSCADVGANFWR